MKKVLFISYYFLPSSVGAAQRVFTFAKYAEKIKSYVLCPKNIDAIYKDSVTYKSPDNITIKEVDSINLSFFRKAKNANMKNENEGSSVKKFLFSFLKHFLFPDKGLFWLFNAIKQGHQIVKEENINCIVSTSPLFSNHLIAYYIKKKTGVNWICDIRDLHYIYHREHEKSIFRILHRRLERKMIQSADQLVFISDEMMNTYSSRYPFVSKKAGVINNGYDHQEMDVDGGQPIAKHHILYAGNFYNGLGNPSALLAGFSQMVDQGMINRDDVYIEIIGHIEKEIVEQFKAYSIFSQVDIKGPMPREVVHKKMNQANLLWLIIPDFRHLREGFALKGYEYMATGNKILGFVPKISMAADILNSTRTGIVLSDELTADSISENAQAILQFITKEPQPNWEEINKYTRQIQAKEMESLILNLV